MTSTHGDVVLSALSQERSGPQNPQIESLFFFRRTVGRSERARSAHLDAVQMDRNRTCMSEMDQCINVKKRCRRTHQRRQRCILLHGFEDTTQLRKQRVLVRRALRWGRSTRCAQTPPSRDALSDHPSYRRP